VNSVDQIRFSAYFAASLEWSKLTSQRKKAMPEWLFVTLENSMHGGLSLQAPRDRFRKQAEDYTDLASEESNPENRRIWFALALECLRLAEGTHIP
jgi:hypothetical protein